MLATLDSAVCCRDRAGGGVERRGRQLPGHARARADDLDAARVRRDPLGPVEVRVPADPGGARQAPEGDRGGDRGVRAHPRRGAEDPRGVPPAPAGGACAGGGDRRACTKAAEEHERESLRGRSPAARGAAGADPPRHRGRGPAGDPGDPQRGRGPDDPGHREGDPQGAQRRGPAAARRRRRSASSTSRRSGSRTARRGSGGGDRTGLFALPVRGRPGARQPRPDQGRAGRVRGRARREPRAVGVLLLARTSRPRRRRTGCGARSWTPTRP